ncbi:hypothetical protein Tco_1545955 [Tanacetum coccineum]
MVVPAIKEVAEPIAKAKEEQVIAPIVDMEEEQMDAPVIDMEEDLAALFGDDDFEDDASDGFDEEEVWEVNEEWLMAPTTPPPMLAMPPPSVYEVGGPSTVPSFPHSSSRLLVSPFVIEDLSTRLGNLDYGHGQLVQRVNQVSDAEVAASVTIGELGPRVYAAKGHVQVIVSQVAHVAERWEHVGAQIDVQQRDTRIQQLQTTVTEMGSKESTLMRCILGLERRIAALERRPPRPQ